MTGMTEQTGTLEVTYCDSQCSHEHCLTTHEGTLSDLLDLAVRLHLGDPPPTNITLLHNGDLFDLGIDTDKQPDPSSVTPERCDVLLAYAGYATCPNERPCDKHPHCVVNGCDNDPTKECDFAGQFVCGAPLCDSHHHIGKPGGLTHG